MATATARVPAVAQFELRPLPFDYDKLEPVISAETLSLHHDKHHRKYVDTMNQLLKESPIQKASSLEDVVRASSGKLFNNAAQSWNHDFSSTTPRRPGTTPSTGNRCRRSGASLRRAS
jgi:superoxide dismutase, Fe-Mn family